MLIPEIALTYQTLLRFYRYFGERVSVMNSSLSDSEKADQWERARRGEIDVIIGPRSALFTPFAQLGVIVIDEEHEGSYKNESMPKYHTREVAEELARLKNACVVLGSATPSLESYYRAQDGTYRLYTLTERLTGGTLPTVEIKMAIKSGFDKALSAIIDGNVTTLIAAAVLAILGSGTIKGFAYTLAIGIVVSMFTALFVTRLLMNIVYALGATDEKFYGKGRDVKLIDFIGKRKIVFAISGIVGYSPEESISFVQRTWDKIPKELKARPWEES